MPGILLSPLTYAMLLVLLLALVWRHLPHVIRIAGIALELALLLSMAPVGANVLVGIVESWAPPTGTCRAPTPTTILLLDGGTERRPRASDDFAALNETSLQRLFAAVQLWRHTPGSRLVISGGGAGMPHSVLLRGLAERMGVPGGAIEIEDRSNTTWENAMYASRLSPRVPKRIWLVTSALHMPRALGAFRAWGFRPCPYSSGSIHTPFSARVGYFVPQSSSLAKADAAIHELVGGIVYRMLAWKHRRAEAGQPADGTRGPPAAASVAPSAQR